MSTPDRRDASSFETFTLGWRIPPEILEPLLHPAAPGAAAEGRADEPADGVQEPADE